MYNDGQVNLKFQIMVISYVELIMASSDIISLYSLLNFQILAKCHRYHFLLMAILIAVLYSLLQEHCRDVKCS